MADKYPSHGDRVETPVVFVGTPDVNVVSTVLAPDAATETTLSNVDSSTSSTATSTSATAASAASMDAKLTTVNGNLSAIENNTDGLETGLADLLTELQLKADLTETQPVSVASLPLPTGASTAALQVTGNVSLASIDAGIPVALGPTAGVNCMPVVIANDQQVLNVFPNSTYVGRVDTYTVVASGVSVLFARAYKSYSICVKGTGAAATAWVLILEVTTDLVNFTEVLRHKTSTGDGQILFSGAVLSPAFGFRSRLVSVTLGPASNLVATIVGME